MSSDLELAAPSGTQQEGKTINLFIFSNLFDQGQDIPGQDF